MRESRYLREIRRLDPVADHSRIVYLDTCYEFPWDTTRSLELALFRTFAVPSVAAVLDSSGEFGRAAQKRYDDTDLILSTIVEAGYDSDEGKRAIRQMNRIHGRFEISNEDFLYVLSSFVFEPIRWNARFGWRPLIEAEKLATFEFWREIGRRMAIKEIPESYAELERYNEEYERRALPAHRTGGTGRPRDPGHVSRLVSRGCRSGSARRRSTRSWTSRCWTPSGSRGRPGRCAQRSKAQCVRAHGSSLCSRRAAVHAYERVAEPEPTAGAGSSRNWVRSGGSA